jgi:hypothetical protein
MTRSTVRSHDTVSRRLLLPLLLFAVALPASVAAPLPKGTAMKTLDVWTVIDYMPTRLPFSTDKIESALNVVLAKASENRFFNFYEAKDLALSQGVTIETLDLRIRKEQPHPGFLVLSFGGACVARADVFGRYDNLKLSDAPRGRSLDENTSWTREEPWGKLTFSFSERARDCLRSVSFDPL